MRAGAGYGYHELTGRPIPDWLGGQGDMEISPVGGWLTRQMDKLHDWMPTSVDRPDDAASRYISTATSVIPFVAAGAPSAGAAVTGSLKAAVPALAGQAVAEAQPFGEDSPGLNNAASLLTSVGVGLLPNLAGQATRYALRGGEGGRQALVDTLQAFNSLGATPSLGQATGNRGLQFLESALAKIPGAAGVMDKFAKNQAKNIGEGVGVNVSNLTSDPTEIAAGRTIQRGVTGQAAIPENGGFLQRFNNTAGRLWKNVDAAIPDRTPVKVDNYRNLLKEFTQVDKDAPASTASLVNPQLTRALDSLNADLASQAPKPPPPQPPPFNPFGSLGGTQPKPAPLTPIQPVDTLPYGALSAMRTRLGEQIGRAMRGQPLVTDVPLAELRRLYGAMTEDMRGAAQAQGPQALQAFERANTHWKAGMGRIEMLQDIVRNDTPEGIYTAAMSGARNGGTRIRSVMQSLKPDEQRTVAGTFLQRMGEETAGAATGTEKGFSPVTFLKNWNNLSDGAKRALFDRFGPDFRSQIDDIAKVSSNIKEGSKVFLNTSGTSHGMEQLSTLKALLGGAGVAYAMEHPADFGGAVTAGLTGAGAAAGGMGVANLLARGVTQPKVVRWAGTNTSVAPWQLGAMLAEPQVLIGNDKNKQRRLAEELARFNGE
jgi:hypothetical protein